ncbi:hypothetical protein DWW47_09040 [Odoribacter splanchnicus]|uniref:Uncharacterized protein n=1 Tax=Odoribacter splanchnicus TaxID=28118 RepID=A0A412WPJ2_9BACT|nr:hypothetical protein DWW47_09040 [Odoribacter splanchnicus]RGV29077.1 hypothetical protein DWW24_04265 [Odoribacter splanchnicus]RHA77644.1 hypothetical protein DW919_09355 [Odoribacter splanchnicus]RHL82151.1 hypothetical protein DWZ99_13055 [Odoribacter splanchnicus]
MEFFLNLISVSDQNLIIHKIYGIYIHVYPKCRFIFSFYSDSGFYTVGPVRLERSGKAFLH